MCPSPALGCGRGSAPRTQIPAARPLCHPPQLQRLGQGQTHMLGFCFASTVPHQPGGPSGEEIQPHGGSLRKCCPHGRCLGSACPVAPSTRVPGRARGASGMFRGQQRSRCNAPFFLTGHREGPALLPVDLLITPALSRVPSTGPPAPWGLFSPSTNDGLSSSQLAGEANLKIWRAPAGRRLHRASGLCWATPFL